MPALPFVQAGQLTLPVGLGAGAVTAGTTLFLLAGPVTAKRGSAQSQDSLLGLALMSGYLACDGFTSTFQARAGAQRPAHARMRYQLIASRLALALIHLACDGFTSTFQARAGPSSLPLPCSDLHSPYTGHAVAAKHRV